VAFNVQHFPVLSRERASELVKEGSALHRQKALPLLATRQLSEPTRELLRKAGMSWVEQLTGVCRLAGRGLLVEAKVDDISRQRKAPSVRARLRQRSGLIAEVLLLTPLQGKIQAAKLIRQTGLSAGLVSRLLHRLARLKLLEINGGGPNRYWRLVDRGGLLDLWAAEEEPPPPTIGLYVWTRSPREMIQKLAILDKVSEHWALGGAAAANVYAPTLTVNPEPAVWFDGRVPPERVARAIGGEIVDKGANLYLCQSDQGLALTYATLWKPPDAAAMEFGTLRIVTRARAYIEALKEDHRSAEIARNLREMILAYAN
jgi:predicted transcriptional regulator